MNTAESASLKRLLTGRGWSAAQSAGEAALVIINTCSVRETAEQRALGRIAHYAALKKKSANRFRLLIMGCMAARLGDKLRENGADYTLGQSQSGEFTRILDEIEKNISVSPCTDDFFSQSSYEEGDFRCFVPVMRGCNNFCSYCIVPYVRGREVSRPPREILDEISFLAGKKVREITLLGQNINSYSYSGGGESMDFSGLLKAIANTVEGTPVRRLRFLTSHPKDFSPRTIDVLRGNPVFCRHIHLCVQHGSNRVLSAMNRRYTREAYLELVRALRDALPALSLSTDILVGFPGETEAEFEEVLTLMEEVKFLYAYMYHYNPREGTAAYNLSERIGEDVKRERLARVIALQKKHTRELLRQRLGAEEEVLVEGPSRKDSGELLCRTERDEMVVAAGDTALAGSFINARILELRGNTLWATRAGSNSW
jgi:tRNA-2-methylthio-N6-dimethylallyladenosine synthase